MSEPGETWESGVARTGSRRTGWVLAVLGAAVVLLGAVPAFFGGSVASSTVPSARPPQIRPATEADGPQYCSFLAPCSASPGTVHADDIARVAIASPNSPNPNSCWYCYVRGKKAAYTRWYVGVDYAHPVAVLKITDALTTQKPVLTLTAPQLRAALAGDGYDLDTTFRVSDYVCVSPCGPVDEMVIADEMTESMSGPAESGETWEWVPIVAERAYAVTDNSWGRLGETRFSGMQKVLVGLDQIVMR